MSKDLHENLLHRFYLNTKRPFKVTILITRNYNQPPLQNVPTDQRQTYTESCWRISIQGILCSPTEESWIYHKVIQRYVAPPLNLRGKKGEYVEALSRHWYQYILTGRTF